MFKLNSRKFLSIFLTLSLFLSSSIVSFAKQENNGHKVIKTKTGVVKFDKSISDIDIDSLSQAVLDELSSQDGAVVSLERKKVDLDPNNNKNRAVKPETDFEITVATQKLNKSGYDAFRFVASGQWKVNPYYEFTDCIGLAWGDGFSLYNDYAYTYSYNPNTGENLKDYDACTPNKYEADKGVAYDVDLKLNHSQQLIVLVADVKKADSTGETNVVAEYGHVIIGPRGVNVGFDVSSSGPSIGMSVGAGAGLEKASPDYAYIEY